MRLTREEQETIINFNQGEQTAHIYTCSKSWMSHLENKLGLKPTKLYGTYAREYELPKTWIRKPRKPRKVSEERRAKLAQRLHPASILSEVTPCAVG